MLVIDRNLFARANIPQSKKQDVTIKRLHVSVGIAAVVDVVRAVAPATAVQTEATVDIANAKKAPLARALPGFEICDSFAGIFPDLSSAFEINRSKAAFAVNSRFPDRQTVRELHQLSLYDET